MANARPDRPHRTTPTWAIAVLMVVVALTVVASIPISHALRAPHERSAQLYQLIDLMQRERDAAVAARGVAEPASTPGTERSAARRAELARLLEVLRPHLTDDLVSRIERYAASTRRLEGGVAIDQRALDAAHRPIDAALVTIAAAAAADAQETELWASVALVGRALIAMTVVIVLFMVLQRRNAQQEFGAGRRAALEEEQRRLRALIAASNDLIVVVDTSGLVTWASPSVAGVLGRSETQLGGFDPMTLVHPDDAPMVAERFAALRNGTTEGPVRLECRVLLGPDGHDERWMAVVASDASGEPGIEGLIVTGRDITEQRRSTQALEVRERELRELMEHVSGVFYRSEVGAQGRWTFISPQITALLGWTPEEWMADPDLWIRSVHPDDRERVMREEQIPTHGAIDYRMITREGELRWVRDDASPILPAGSATPYWAGTLTDVTHAYRVEEELRFQAHHDPLTNLPNRALMLDRLGNALDRSRRKPSEVGVVFVDLDDFKTVNDELGHAAGDALLVAVAERLRAAIRAGDTAARLGGDEFALLVDEIDGASLAVVADRVMEALEAPVDVAGRQVVVTASVGVAISMGVETDPKRMLRDADTAMYVAKRQGKHRRVHFEPGMAGPQRQRVRMESDLRRALTRGEFSLVYQPVVRLADGRIEGAEALLRWHHPELGAIDPGEFLDVAEESGLLVHIGRWVLRRACADAAMWQRTTRRGIWLGVNVSARQLLDPGMVPSVTGALAETGLAPGQLVLEITERVALRDLDAAEARLAELRAAGARLAIDDFGTGTSAIGHLRRLDFDVIKIHGSLVSDVHRSTDAQALVRSIVHIARTLRAQPLAEGVEEAQQVEALRAAGCELGQGYLFARPMDAYLLRDTFLPRNLGANAG